MFLNLYSQHIILGLSLHSSFLSTFRFTAVMAVSSNTQSLQSSVCVQTFQHIRLPQGTSAYVQRWHLHERIFSVSRSSTFAHAWGSCIPAAPQQCPTTSTTTAETAGRNHSLLSDGYFSKRNR